MTTQSVTLELITPCFCAGADPSKAEIRAPSIRGQLRWWFRVLGGFKGLSMDMRSQESMIFGSISGDSGRAGQLITRVANTNLKQSVKDSAQLGHHAFSGPAYLTFPIQSRNNQYNGRGVIDGGSFDLQTIWRGNPDLNEPLKALISVFGHLGSLGFRGRRALGALAFKEAAPMSLADALKVFNAPNSILLKKMAASSASDAISKLGSWLKACRAHGRTGQNQQERQSPYFQYAKRDHDIGYGLIHNQPAYRPALGLPIIQTTRQGTKNWDLEQNPPKGRFASPVLLRPHKTSANQYCALVIFVESRKWATGTPAFINNRRIAVATDLYEAMKNDPLLQTF
jgi:CRISPR type III-B/RAMP module RAMP protein Cmr1